MHVPYCYNYSIKHLDIAHSVQPLKSVSRSVAVCVYLCMHESCIGHCGWVLGVGAALEMIFQATLGHIFLVTSFKGTS